MRKSGARRASCRPGRERNKAVPSPSAVRSGPAPVRAAGTGLRSAHLPARGLAPARTQAALRPARPRSPASLPSNPQPPPSSIAAAPVPAVPERPRAAAPSPGSGGPEPERLPGSTAPPRPAPPRCANTAPTARTAYTGAARYPGPQPRVRKPRAGVRQLGVAPAALRGRMFPSAPPCPESGAVSEELQPPRARTSASRTLRRAHRGAQHLPRLRSSPSGAPRSIAPVTRRSLQALPASRSAGRGSPGAELEPFCLRSA